ncbi:hypothetical protein CXF96_13035 [Stenotrophomonas sp. Betaine-02u-21]|nr:hypothetical protein CXF96_13035 [Stenotrophomonas sp. Betaine-02u-21]PKH76626.1 hypothetical protein CXF90_00560 [Stenotrophomonas sp. Betaine-02u-23]PKH96024.1 hypothetical protein CXG43_09725 [Stenotrophomonas sp. Bg11-02]
MRLNFESRGGSAYDAMTGISIPLPRMLPATLGDGRTMIEFEYAFLRGGERLGGLGILGHEVLREEAGGREWLYTIEFVQDSNFKSLRHFKHAIGDAGEEFCILQAVAQGLVNVFPGRLTQSESQRNRVVTTVDAVTRNGISICADAVLLSDGWVLLAECRVPANDGG